MALTPRNRINPNFNMSSLTDIIFLLLIFFMLTSTLVAPSAIKVLLPSSTSQTLATQTVRVIVSQEEDYYVDETKVDFKDLKGAIQSKLSDEEEPTVVLEADKRLTVETMVNVMSVIKELDVRMIIATNPVRQ